METFARIRQQHSLTCRFGKFYANIISVRGIRDAQACGAEIAAALENPDLKISRHFTGRLAAAGKPGVEGGAPAAVEITLKDGFRRTLELAHRVVENMVGKAIEPGRDRLKLHFGVRL